jgi:hypothetical protein
MLEGERFGLQTKMPRGEFGYALAIMESTLDTPKMQRSSLPYEQIES